MIGGANSIVVHSARIRARGPFLAQFTFLLAALLLSIGCSDSAPQVYRVTGTVTRGGRPVPHVSVNFTPTSGRPSYALTDENGWYKLGFTRKIEGALPGKHKVAIGIPAAGAAPNAPPPSPELQAIAKKYGAGSSPLEVEVTEDGQVIDLHLD
jgi:hypothetical protein